MGNGGNGKKNSGYFHLPIGYIPKDISWNLSVLLDNEHIFRNEVIAYGGNGTKT